MNELYLDTAALNLAYRVEEYARVNHLDKHQREYLVGKVREALRGVSIR